MKKILLVKALWAVLKYVQVFIYFHIFYNITKIVQMFLDEKEYS